MSSSSFKSYGFEADRDGAKFVTTGSGHRVRDPFVRTAIPIHHFRLKSHPLLRLLRDSRTAAQSIGILILGLYLLGGARDLRTQKTDLQKNISPPTLSIPNTKTP